MSRLLNFAIFYIGWFACVWGAGLAQFWLGPVVVAGFLVLHLSTTPNRGHEASLIVLTGILGFVSDTVQASLGLYSFMNGNAPAWLCPLWMVALWMLFASTLNSSMSWLAGRFGLGAVLGAICGPLSYLAGERLGAIELHANRPLTFAGIAVAWACIMPTLLSLRGVLSTSAASVQLRLPARALVVLGAVSTLIVSTARSGTAAEIEGVRFDDQYQRDDVTLALRCVGLLRYKVLFKGYVAGLYLGPGVASEDALVDVPKRLELSYFWSIKGSDFGKAGNEVLARNVDPNTLEQLRPQLEQINALYETVNPGDRYALTYIPGRGTELALNGQSKGVIPGADFAAAYFRIWLGDQSIDEALRDQLLSCRKAA